LTVKITGTTRLHVIFGDPLHKARSPETFNAIFEERGVDAVLVPGEVDCVGFEEAVRGFQRLRNCDGIIITMPHKQAMCAFVDELLENGRLVGAINAARRLPGGRWQGDMFDGRGYVAALRNRGIDPKAKRVHLIGAGGVARAMAVALAQAGAASISLRDIDVRRARHLADTVNAAFPAVRATAVEEDEYDRDIIANATPLGMRENDELPCDPSRIAPSTVVTDVIPKPDITPFLAAARKRGCQVVTGRDMVEGQAGLMADFLDLKRVHR
jgi:shikimate dehydrogenase